MARLSRKTLGAAIRYLVSRSGTGIDQFFYEREIPDDMNVGNSKLARVMRVFRILENDGKYDVLERLIFDMLPPRTTDQSRELETDLARDGFVQAERGLAKDVPRAEESRTAVEILIERHAEDLDEKTLVHHLRENVDLFSQEKWDSSIGHARNFVEQLLRDVAQAVAKQRGETPDLRMPMRVRQYLQDAGFFDKAEHDKLANGVYGYFSEEGSHPGISTHSAARVCIHILWAFGYYVLEKFENWKARTARP